MPNPWDDVLAQLAALKTEIAALQAWKAQVEAVWPQIVEEVTNGAD